MTSGNEFVTKDSGSMSEYADGMRRDATAGKPKFRLMWPKGVPYAEQLMTRVAALYARGGERYGDRNWEKSSTPESLAHHTESTERHLHQFLEGVEDGEDHAAAVVWGINAVLLTRRNIAAKGLQPDLTETPAPEKAAAESQEVREGDVWRDKYGGLWDASLSRTHLKGESYLWLVGQVGTPAYSLVPYVTPGAPVSNHSFEHFFRDLEPSLVSRKHEPKLYQAELDALQEGFGAEDEAAKYALIIHNTLSGKIVEWAREYHGRPEASKGLSSYADFMAAKISSEWGTGSPEPEPVTVPEPEPVTVPQPRRVLRDPAGDLWRENEPGLFTCWLEGAWEEDSPYARKSLSYLQGYYSYGVRDVTDLADGFPWE